jgi:hypothetical protein
MRATMPRVTSVSTRVLAELPYYSKSNCFETDRFYHEGASRSRNLSFFALTWVFCPVSKIQNAYLLLGDVLVPFVVSS